VGVLYLTFRIDSSFNVNDYVLQPLRFDLYHENSSTFFLLNMTITIMYFM